VNAALLNGNKLQLSPSYDRICGLVIRVPGYRSRSPGFDSRCYQILWDVVGMKRGPLSLVSTIEELLGRNSSSSGLEIREYGRRDPLRWPRDTLYQQKLALTSPTSGGRLVGKVRSRTKAKECLCFCLILVRDRSLSIFPSHPTLYDLAIKCPQRKPHFPVFKNLLRSIHFTQHML
jgi:hypothetical protein